MTPIQYVFVLCVQIGAVSFFFYRLFEEKEGITFFFILLRNEITIVLEKLNNKYWN